MATTRRLVVSQPRRPERTDGQATRANGPSARKWPSQARSTSLRRALDFYRGVWHFLRRSTAIHIRKYLRRLLVRLGLIAGSLFFVLLLLEGAVRLFWPQQLIQLRPDIWQPDDGLGARHAPMVDARINTGEREIRFLTDAHGYRIGPQPAAPGARPVLALGDSFLEAIQVSYDDTMTAHLERGLSVALGGAVEIVNTGVAGWGPNHYLLAARAELERRPYEAVIVFLFLGNDVIERRRAHFGAWQPAARHALRFPRSLTRRELVDALAYPLNDTLETRSHLFTLLKTRLKFLLMRLGLSKHYFPDVLLIDDEDDGRWALTAEVCAELDALAAAHDAPTLFVFLPGLYQVDRAATAAYVEALGIDPGRVDLDQPGRQLATQLAARGLTMIDTTPALRAAHEAGRVGLYGTVDTHLGPAGHAVVAEAVLPALQDLLQRRLAVEAPPPEDEE